MGNYTSSSAAQSPAAAAPVPTPVLGYKSIVVVRRATIRSKTTPGEIILDTVNHALSEREIFKGHFLYGLLYLSLINACWLEQNECAVFARFASSLQMNSMQWLDLTVVVDRELATEEVMAEFARKWMLEYQRCCRRRRQMSARAEWHASLGLTAIEINNNGKRLRDESESDNETTAVAKKTRTLPPPAVQPPSGYYINRSGDEVRIRVPAQLNPLSTYQPPKDTLFQSDELSDSKSKFIQALEMARFRSQSRLGRGGWHEKSWERKLAPSPLQNEVEEYEAPPPSPPTSGVYQFTFRVPFVRSVSLADLNLDLTRRVTRFSSQTTLRFRLPKWLLGQSAA